MKHHDQGVAGADQVLHRLAVLIDADNAQPSIIEEILAEVAKYGTASVKRIYGDFTSQQQSQWKKMLLRFSISPVQQFAYTSGKNATDSALIIDAMDLMYTRRFDGFCLVSSDSDFTRLAQRLREEGLTVYGFGERKTPDPFVQACDKFTYTELLKPRAPASHVASVPGAVGAAKELQKKSAAAASDVVGNAKGEAPADVTPDPLDLIGQAIEEASDERGWAHLGAVGHYLLKIRPDFDPRLYGHRKLSDLVRDHAERFALEIRGGSGSSQVLYAKNRG